jgi:hypothetical protein
MQKNKVSLQVSECAVFQVAGNIYAAYLTAGKVPEGDEKKWMDRSLTEAIQLAQMSDARVQSDSELD